MSRQRCRQALWRHECGRPSTHPLHCAWCAVGKSSRYPSRTHVRSAIASIGPLPSSFYLSLVTATRSTTLIIMSTTKSVQYCLISACRPSSHRRRHQTLPDMTALSVVALERYSAVFLFFHILHKFIWREKCGF